MIVDLLYLMYSWSSVISSITVWQSDTISASFKVKVSFGQ